MRFSVQPLKFSKIHPLVVLKNVFTSVRSWFVAEPKRCFSAVVEKISAEYFVVLTPRPFLTSVRVSNTLSVMDDSHSYSRGFH